ncbi:hypothetical protein B0H13DRAFT_1852171 [Mycena leptocephala]|nr:hypothetical protein B0H13DRAFT_1852171 [Mycena leptocephala]
MDTIPAELVDSIAHEIHDMASLKAFALAGSPFRESCQRILLRKVTIQDTYTAMLAFLEESPHIAAYIRGLYLELPTDARDIECFPHLLRKFHNVTHLMICGPQYNTRWADVPETILDFIQRQTLEQVNIHLIKELPHDVLAFILSAARTVSFDFASAKTSSNVNPGAAPVLPKMENLGLFFDARISVMTCSARDSHRTWETCADSGDPYPTRTSNTLQEISFNCGAMPDEDESNHNSFLLPHLPSIRSFELMIRAHHRDAQWLVDVMCTLLKTNAQEIVVFCHGYDLATDISTQTMHALNDALRDRPVFPRLNWWLADDASLESFRAAVEKGIPRAHLANRLSVERGATTFYRYGSRTWVGL